MSRWGSSTSTGLRTGGDERNHSLFGDGVGLGRARGEPPHADAGPVQRVGVEGVRGRLVGRNGAGGGIVRVEPLQHGERQRGVNDVAGHRAGRVLLGRDRHHPGAVHQTRGSA